VDSSWIVAFGLMLLLEGIVPFLFPRHWRNLFDRICRLDDGQIRFLGLVAFLGGLATLWLARF
jgi:uncharacterized protein YjeT (DUF2065 family)